MSQGECGLGAGFRDRSDATPVGVSRCRHSAQERQKRKAPPTLRRGLENDLGAGNRSRTCDLSRGDVPPDHLILPLIACSADRCLRERRRNYSSPRYRTRRKLPICGSVEGARPKFTEPFSKAFFWPLSLPTPWDGFLVAPRDREPAQSFHHQFCYLGRYTAHPDQ